ncbi:MAG: hypothetical protein QXP81_09660 [Nitrososphaerota archaeon]
MRRASARRGAGLSAIGYTVLAAVLLLATLAAASVSAGRVGLFGTPTENIAAVAQYKSGFLLVDVVNIGTAPARVLEVQLLKDGRVVWSSQAGFELQPSASRRITDAVQLSEGSYAVLVRTERGLYGSGHGGSLACRRETYQYTEPVYGWRDVLVGYRDVYREVERRVWDVIGYRQVPVYETRTRQVWAVIDYRQVPVYETRTRQVWGIIGYRQVPLYDYGIVGYRSVPRTYTYTDYRCSFVPRTTYEYSCYYQYDWFRGTFVYRCSVIPRTTYEYQCTPITRTYTVYEQVPVYGMVLIGYRSEPIYGWRTETYQELVGYRSEPVYGWKTETYQELVGYRSEPVYGWRTVTVRERVGTEPVYDRVWSFLGYEPRTREEVICDRA